MHNGRNGSPRHNDRTFLNDMSESEIKEQADHINQEKSGDNVIWNLYSGMTFADAELKYYKDTFTDSLLTINERYKKQRHPERCRSIENLYHNNKTCPEETILQIGRKDDKVSEDIAKKCFIEFVDYMNEYSRNHSNLFQILNYSIHADESSYHVHIRKVWQYEDKDGNMRAGMNKALKNAGVKFFDESKPESRYNNRKMTFDADVREKWQQICINHGLDIDKVAIHGRRHKEKNDYIRSINAEEINKQKEEYYRLIQENAIQTGLIEEEQKDLAATRDLVTGLTKESILLDNQIEAKKDFVEALPDDLRLDELKNYIEESINSLQTEVGYQLIPVGIHPAKKGIAGKIVRQETIEISSEDFEKVNSMFNDISFLHKVLQMKDYIASLGEKIKKYLSKLKEQEEQDFAKKSEKIINKYDLKIKNLEEDIENLKVENKKLKEENKKIRESLRIIEILKKNPSMNKLINTIKKMLKLEKSYDLSLKEKNETVIYNGKEYSKESFAKLYNLYAVENNLAEYARIDIIENGQIPPEMNNNELYYADDELEL